jgi:hypothetical protein
MLPLMVLIGRAFGFSREKVRLSFVKVNNELILASGARCTPDKLLALAPHCIQRSDCPHRLTTDVERCARCGRCPVEGLLTLRDSYGFKLSIATGGAIARRIVVELRPKLIIAIACERDLSSGIQDCYPIPVFGLPNERPCGPCRDTLFSLARFEELVRYFCLTKNIQFGTFAHNTRSLPCPPEQPTIPPPKRAISAPTAASSFLKS